MTKKTTGTNKSDVQDDHPPNDIGRDANKPKGREREISAGRPGRLRATRGERKV